MTMKICFIFIIVSVYLLLHAEALPRLNSGILPPNRRASPVKCDHQEATKDPVCDQICLPKGYSHGICVGGKCNCV